MDPDLSFLQHKKLIITGGGGYLGSKLAEYLSCSGTDIFLLDIFYNEIALRLFSSFSNIIKEVCDLTNLEQLVGTMNKIQPDLVFHFGALLNRERDFTFYNELYKVNVNGTLNLLESLKNINYSGLYYASTSEVYGNDNMPPYREDQNPSPVSPYSLTKLMAENLIITYSQINKKPYTILRIFNFYGPEMPNKFFITQLESSLLNNIPFKMTAGEQKRDYLTIDELVTLIIKITKSRKCNKEIINLCSGKATKVKELAEKIAHQQNKLHLLEIGGLPYRENEIWEMVGNNTKLSHLID